MTRDEIKKDIADAIDKQFPENIDLDGDDIDTIVRAVEETTESATEAIDSGEDDEDDVTADDSKK